MPLIILSGILLTSAIPASQAVTVEAATIAKPLRNFEQLNLAATNLRISMHRQQTEAQVTLKIKNYSTSDRALTLQETMAIEKIVLVDAIDRSYDLEEVAGDLSKTIPSSGDALTLRLKFNMPTGVRPSYLFIEQTHGESITVKL